MNFQEAKELREKFKEFYDNEEDIFVQHKLKNILMTLDIILMTLDIIISDLRLKEAEKIISDRSLDGSERTNQKINELRAKLPEPQKCSLCQNPLFDAMKSSDEEPYVIDDKPVCRDCYFDELGEFIEKNPIWIPFGSINEHK